MSYYKQNKNYILTKGRKVLAFHTCGLGTSCLPAGNIFNSLLGKPTTALQGTLSGTKQITHAMMEGTDALLQKSPRIVRATNTQMVISQIQFRFMY